MLLDVNTELLINQIAQECHLKNDELMLANGEVPNSTSWHEMDDHMKDMNIKSVKKALLNPNLTAKDMHDEWMKNKIADGWRYGITKDADQKTHPLIIDFDKMNDIDKLKDQIFIDVVNKYRPQYEDLNK